MTFVNDLEKRAFADSPSSNKRAFVWTIWPVSTYYKNNELFLLFFRSMKPAVENYVRNVLAAKLSGKILP